MSEIERVKKAWERIEQWYQKNMTYTLPEGATAAEIHELEQGLSLTLPEGIKASLLRHNGIEDSKWPNGRLLPAEDILDEWKTWKDEEEKPEPPKGKSEAYQNVWWSESWVPIQANYEGNGFVLDMKPGPKGTIGQIFEVDHDSGPGGTMYEDFAEYLEDFATGFETGRYTALDGEYIEENYGGGESEKDEDEDEDEEGEGEGDDDD